MLSNVFSNNWLIYSHCCGSPFSCHYYLLVIIAWKLGRYPATSHALSFGNMDSMVKIQWVPRIDSIRNRNIHTEAIFPHCTSIRYHRPETLLGKIMIQLGTPRPSARENLPSRRKPQRRIHSPVDDIRREAKQKQGPRLISDTLAHAARRDPYRRSPRVHSGPRCLSRTGWWFTPIIRKIYCDDNDVWLGVSRARPRLRRLLLHCSFVARTEFSALVTAAWVWLVLFGIMSLFRRCMRYARGAQVLFR